MNLARKAVFLAVGAFLCACTSMNTKTPLTDGVAHRVSPDYTAIGVTDNINAYVYGTRTVIELNKNISISVKDSNGQSVEFERVGQYMRLSRILDNFTVDVGGHTVKFISSPVPTTEVYTAKIQAPVVVQPVINADNSQYEANYFKKASYSNEQLAALLDLSQKQINEVKTALAQAKTTEQIKEASAKLTLIENNLTSATATVFANFKPYSAKLSIDAETSRILIEAAKVANYINITGYTNTQVGGTVEAKVAAKRSEAAKQYLIKNGVDSEKIRTFSVATGEFIAPNRTKKGAQLNRRVEIEMAMPKFNQQSQQTQSI